MQELPNAIEAEKHYIGSILVDPSILNFAKISAEMFYNSRLKKIYKAILSVENPDYVSVHAFLKNSGDEEISLAELTALSAEVTTTSNVKHHAKIIQEMYVRRLMIGSVSDFMGKLYSDDLVSTINSMKEILLRTHVGNNYEMLENPELIDQWYKTYDVPPVFYKTGIWTIDNAIGGFTPTDFGLVLADTNVGKTTLLLNMAVQMAKDGKHVLFFSLEMTANQLNDKLIAIYGKHDARGIKTRQTPKQELQTTVEAFKRLPITVIHKGAITSQDVVSEAYNRKISGQVDVVMLDYCQRLSDKSKESETIKMKTIAQNLKNFALVNEIPVITPAQVDKASSQGGKIRVENVAWAKALADEADTALYLYEKDIEQKGGAMLVSNFQIEKELRCRVVKSRHSEKGQDFKIDFDRTTLRMEDNVGEFNSKFN